MATPTTKLRLIEWQGPQWCLSHLAQAHGLNPGTLFQRVVRQGWPVERALSAPVRKRRHLRKRRG
jgi:hypothetical protein